MYLYQTTQHSRCAVKSFVCLHIHIPKVFILKSNNLERTLLAPTQSWDSSNSDMKQARTPTQTQSQPQLGDADVHLPCPPTPSSQSRLRLGSPPCLSEFVLASTNTPQNTSGVTYASAASGY
ncbi:hypothetical protein AV530_013874 [Patagioenas fasciata monilis]|uniref:Uncharacterized protein n=1 Tax=Patagioenas fasciata monilis TaxID=372326 RepID=A0A1V4KMX0_PATFA|nr:hypothetical protein AV530_013874 [Patagioenas fasciata monilis]